MFSFYVTMENQRERSLKPPGRKKTVSNKHLSEHACLIQSCQPGWEFMFSIVPELHLKRRAKPHKRSFWQAMQSLYYQSAFDPAPPLLPLDEIFIQRSDRNTLRKSTSKNRVMDMKGTLTSESGLRSLMMGFSLTDRWSWYPLRMSRWLMESPTRWMLAPMTKVMMQR